MSRQALTRVHQPPEGCSAVGAHTPCPQRRRLRFRNPGPPQFPDALVQFTDALPGKPALHLGVLQPRLGRGARGFEPFLSDAFPERSLRGPAVGEGSLPGLDIRVASELLRPDVEPCRQRIAFPLGGFPRGGAPFLGLDASLSGFRCDVLRATGLLIGQDRLSQELLDALHVALSVAHPLLRQHRIEVDDIHPCFSRRVAGIGETLRGLPAPDFKSCLCGFPSTPRPARRRISRLGTPIGLRGYPSHHLRDGAGVRQTGQPSLRVLVAAGGPQLLGRHPGTLTCKFQGAAFLLHHGPSHLRLPEFPARIPFPASDIIEGGDRGPAPVRCPPQHRPYPGPPGTHSEPLHHIDGLRRTIQVGTNLVQLIPAISELVDLGAIKFRQGIVQTIADEAHLELLTQFRGAGDPQQLSHRLQFFGGAAQQLGGHFAAVRCCALMPGESLGAHVLR